MTSVPWHPLALTVPTLIGLWWTFDTTDCSPLPLISRWSPVLVFLLPRWSLPNDLHMLLLLHHLPSMPPSPKDLPRMFSLLDFDPFPGLVPHPGHRISLCFNSQAPNLLPQTSLLSNNSHTLTRVVVQQCFSTQPASHSPGGLVKTQLLGPTLRVSDSVGLGVGPKNLHL